MRLSILLPTHERPETLLLAIRSIQHQQFEDWELLVCGDGCGPATEEIMASACGADSRIRWFPLPKAPGFGYANRNLVLKEARGELIGFAAHDNLFFPDHWRRLVAAFDNPTVAMACSSAAWMDGKGKIIPTIFNLADAVIRGRFICKMENRIPANAFVYRRSLHQEIGGWDETLEKCGDLDLWSRILRHSGVDSFRYIPFIGFIHFRASWKNAAAVPDPTEAGVWPALVSQTGRLPEALSLSIPEGMLPQQVVFNLLHGPDGARWQEEIREACALAMESCAWETEQALLAQIDWSRKLEATLKANKEALTEAKASLKKFKSENRRQSRLWRFFNRKPSK